jgi:hypothetical protein
MTAADVTREGLRAVTDRPYSCAFPSSKAAAEGNAYSTDAAEVLTMAMRRERKWTVWAIAGLFLAMASIRMAAIEQKAPAPRKTDTLALGEDEVKQLLLLMDTDKNGKISKQEFMKFMEAEFDRLDKDKSGELDPRELTQSKLRASPFARVGK